MPVSDRRIGRFDEGYEASFVALAGNPVEDFSQVQRIVRRFKQGVNLDRSFRHDAPPLQGPVTGLTDTSGGLDRSVDMIVSFLFICAGGVER